jgi:hypothetical protein
MGALGVPHPTCRPLVVLGQKLYHFPGQAWMLLPNSIFSPQIPFTLCLGNLGRKNDAV